MNSESDQDRLQAYLPHDLAKSAKNVIEVPAQLEDPYVERIPSGFVPMGQIRLEGRAFRNLAGGHAPRWVLITGCLLFGGLAFSFLSIGLSALPLNPGLLLIGIPILLSVFIMARGTLAKIFQPGRGR